MVIASRGATSWSNFLVVPLPLPHRLRSPAGTCWIYCAFGVLAVIFTPSRFPDQIAELEHGRGRLPEVTGQPRIQRRKAPMTDKTRDIPDNVRNVLVIMTDQHHRHNRLPGHYPVVDAMGESRSPTASPPTAICTPARLLMTGKRPGKHRCWPAPSGTSPTRSRSPKGVDVRRNYATP